MAIDKKELWVGFAHDATSRYVVPDEIEDANELANDMVDVAVDYADLMLEEYERRFSGRGGSAPARGRRRSRDAEPEGED